MENNLNFKEILLNLKELKIKTEIIEKYCMETKHNNPLSITKNYIIKFLSQYNIDKSRIGLKTMYINQKGLFININKEIDQVLSKYNLSLKEKYLVEKLNRTTEELKKIKKIKQLEINYPNLYKDYVGNQNHKHINQSIKKFIQKEALKIGYLKRRINTNFTELTNVGKYLNEEQVKRLKLIIAYQMITLTDKEEYRQVSLKYLNEFLIRNQDLLTENYQYRIKENENLGIETYTTFSIKKVKDFIDKEKQIKQYQKNKREIIPIEKTKYSFQEQHNNNHYEILEKYYKLGLLSKSEEEKKELLKRKITYYKNLNIKKIKIGVNSFEGYIGLCLEDNTIILDKLFDNILEGKISTNQAIYITTEDEFSKIMQLPKTECIKKINQGTIIAQRVLHTGTWENRTEEKIQKLTKKKEKLTKQ